MDDSPLIPDRHVDLIVSEYAILQSKIDKIGEFKFKVRGWSLTLIVAFVVLTKDGISSWIIGIGCLLFTALFFLLELEQARNAEVVIARLKELERTVRMSRSPAPLFAGFALDYVDKPSSLLGVKLDSKLIRRLKKNTIFVFYGVLCLIGFAVMLFPSGLKKAPESSDTAHPPSQLPSQQSVDVNLNIGESLPINKIEIEDGVIDGDTKGAGKPHLRIESGKTQINQQSSSSAKVDYE